MKIRARQFENCPLITHQLAKIDPEKIFEYPPNWVVGWAFPGAADDELSDNQSRTVVLVVGKKHRKPITLTALQYALLAEATRLGHGIATNSNFGQPVPKVYAKLTFRDAAKDTMPVRRFFAGAKAFEAISTLEIASDLRPQNLMKTVAGKPDKDAIAVLIKHVERIATERELSGTMPEGLTKEDYLENFHTILKAVEEEREAAGE